MSQENIAILMATYNGESYLGEQLDSILQQDFAGWHLYVHDDGSTDRTRYILQEYQQRYPQQITILEYPSQHGACANFISLLAKVEANYYMFSDQDDVWLPNKVSLSLEAMHTAEKEDAAPPIIVYTDLRVVDENLKEIAPSLWEIEQIYPNSVRTFVHALGTNVATGCTMLFNNAAKACLNMQNPICTMHDSWIVLSALAHHGRLCPIATPTILYRQHQQNCLGAVDTRQHTVWSKLRNIDSVIQRNREFYQMAYVIKPISIGTYLYGKIRYFIIKKIGK